LSLPGTGKKIEIPFLFIPFNSHFRLLFSYSFYVGCYSASKFAVEGLSDAWRRESWPWDVNVIIIEPGIMKTNLYDQPFSKEKNEEMYNQLDPEVRDLFGREYFEKNLESFRYFLFATCLPL